MSDRITKKILGATRRAVEDYSMINEGDVICVGVSGGKDSVLLLYALSLLSRFYPKHFTVFGVSVDMGNGVDYAPLIAFCNENGIKLHIKKTRIYDIVFNERKESNPCSLCSNLRRGALYIEAKALGANKVALGHHYDDATETFMLNLIHEGRLGCFRPVTYLDRSDLTVIRPLIYLREKEVARFVLGHGIPVVKNPCPADGATQRQSVKELLKELDGKYPGVEERIFGAVQRSGIDGWGLEGVQLRSRKVPSEKKTSESGISED